MGTIHIFYTFAPMERHIDINDFNYNLPDERIAKFPLEERSSSKLLVYDNGTITESHFRNVADFLPKGATPDCNNTRVVGARTVAHQASGARIAFDYKGQEHSLRAEIVERGTREHIVRFRWSAECSFGQLLETLGRIPIPPYLNRESEDIDNTRYQTVYARFEGSVAAPTAGLHFTPELIEGMREEGYSFEEVTLHVGAGTFLPVKDDDAAQHPMHTEHFSVTRSAVENLLKNIDNIVAVGTTSVRTLESLSALAWRIKSGGSPEVERTIGQWELYDIPDTFDGKEALSTLLEYMRESGLDRLKASTQIMITPLGYRFRIVSNIITNFHQPKSTLLLLVSAYVGGDWKRIYDYALTNGFRFLSYGDSSLLKVRGE